MLMIRFFRGVMGHLLLLHSVRPVPTVLGPTGPNTQKLIQHNSYNSEQVDDHDDH